MDSLKEAAARAAEKREMEKNLPAGVQGPSAEQAAQLDSAIKRVEELEALNSEMSKIKEEELANLDKVRLEYDLPSHDVKVIHEFMTSGNHRLVLESREGKSAQHSQWGDYKSVIKLTDPVSGITYCGATDYHSELPKVFMVAVVGAEERRA